MFDIKKHLIKVQGGRQYLPVAARLLWFKEEHPDWSIETEVVNLDLASKTAVCRASVKDENGRIKGQGTKMEDSKGFGDYLEKAETGAIGRALAVVGFGTKFAPDLDDHKTDFNQRSTYSVREEADSQVIEGNFDSRAKASDGAVSTGCTSCGLVLTPSQASLSLRKFGTALCPACQNKRKAAN